MYITSWLLPDDKDTRMPMFFCVPRLFLPLTSLYFLKYIRVFETKLVFEKTKLTYTYSDTLYLDFI